MFREGIDAEETARLDRVLRRERRYTFVTSHLRSYAFICGFNALPSNHSPSLNCGYSASLMP
jgi:hypothetical protein